MKVLALDAPNDSLADVLGIEDISHQFVIGSRKQEVRTRSLDGEFRSQAVNQLIRRARGIDLREHIEVLPENGRGFAVEDEFDIGIAAGPRDAKLVRAAQRGHSSVGG